MTDFDLKLNIKFYNRVSKIQTKVKSYRANIFRTKKFFKSATKTSKDDIQDKLKEFSKNPTPKNGITLFRNLFNSGTWIGRSGIRHIHSLVDFTSKGNNYELSAKERTILKKISLKDQDHSFTNEEIFKVIYNEIEYSHYFPKYKATLNTSTIKTTIVLIPGVFNELFSTAAFERAACHLNKNLGIKYLCPRINGIKSSKFNADLISKQLKRYIKKNPSEKLWLVAFSKGGVDALHFLRKEAEFSEKYIVGLSTIASPILGSDHFNHRFLQLFGNLNGFNFKKIQGVFKYASGKLSKDFQQSISSTYQRPWLRNNYEKLPQGIFYTALGFKSEWYESHFWMMLAKVIFKSRANNDGVVDTKNALFPYYFKQAQNLGILKGHHLVGTRSSYFCQEALLESLLIYLNYKGLIS